MTKIGLAGDWHGDHNWAMRSIATFADAGVADVFQLGDFGLGWPGSGRQMHSYVQQACGKYGVSLYIVPGNHENWEYINSLEFEENRVARISSHVYVLGRGFKGELVGPNDEVRTVAALGGAPSIDFQSRVEGRDWWRSETITYGEAVEVAQMEDVDILLMHDSPTHGTNEVASILAHNPQGWPSSALQYANQGRALVDMVVESVKPKVFAHGHYHVAGERQTDETLFLALNMNVPPYNSNMELAQKQPDSGWYKSMAVLDLDTLTHEWLEAVTSG